MRPAYDALDRLKSETWSQLGGGTTPLACSGNNTQDLPIGNRSAPAESNDVTTPPSGTSIVYSASWTYDGAGNRLTQLENAVQTTYEYDAQNRLERELQAGNPVVEYGYDLNGNQISRTENSVVEAFTFDYMNRIETYAKGTVNFLYKYTPDGKRLAKIDAAGPQEWFMYDGDDVSADYTRTGGSGPRTLARTYVNGRSIDAKIARIDEPAGTLNYYVGDAIGSVHEMISPAGTIVRQALYAAWGKPLPGFGGVPFQDRHSFTQREDDPESGLMHYRARSYDPRMGRFIQKDPILQYRATEHYIYASNDPCAKSDPTGERSYIRVNHGNKQIVVTTRIVVVSDQGGASSAAVAGRIAKSIHTMWNNSGGGWKVNWRDNTGSYQGYSLTFEPEIVETDEDVLLNSWASFSDFDKVLFSHNGDKRAEVREVPGLDIGNDGFYSGANGLGKPLEVMNADSEPGFKGRRRPVNPPLELPHLMWLNNQADDWDLGHEYGHFLSLIDRYRREYRSGKWVILDDSDATLRLMGSRIQGTAQPLDIADLFSRAGIFTNWKNGVTAGAAPANAAIPKVSSVSASSVGTVSPTLKPAAGFVDIVP